MHGALFVPIILGSDKMTVSVATSHNEYWPLYASIGNIHNNVRSAHGAGLILVGFLSIPKSNSFFLPLLLPSDTPDLFLSADKAQAGSVEFWQFWQKLFHVSLSLILESLCAGEKMPELFWCPDGHYQCDLGDWTLYSQLPWAGIIDMHCTRLVSSVSHPAFMIYSIWIPHIFPCRHQGNKKDLDGELSKYLHSHEYTEELVKNSSVMTLWKDFGIILDVVVCSPSFFGLSMVLTNDLG